MRPLQALIALAGVDGDAVWLLLTRLSCGEGGAGPPQPIMPPGHADVFPLYKDLLLPIKMTGSTSIAEMRTQVGMRKRAHALLVRLGDTASEVAWHKRATVPDL